MLIIRGCQCTYLDFSYINFHIFFFRKIEKRFDAECVFLLTILFILKEELNYGPRYH